MSSEFSQQNTRLKNQVQTSSHRWMSFEEAKAFIRSEGIQTSIEFEEWKRSGKRPEDFPSNPDKIYKKEWISWGDFFGTGSIAHRKKEFMSFEEAKAFIRNEGIQTSAEFEAWKRSGKRPEDFPSNPHRTYKEEWTGWVDFLGTENALSGKKEFMNFEEAQAFIWSEGIQTRREFEAWSRSGKRPEDFPANPQRTYKKEWAGWGNFLETGNISNRKKEFMSFEDAKTFIRNEGIQTRMEFEAWKRAGKRPEDFPSNPHRTYKEEWTGWVDFLGTGNIAPRRKKRFMSFKKAKTFIRNQGIQTSAEFKEWKRSGKRPKDFPSAPDLTYKEEWTGWNNFLGTGNIAPSRKKRFMSFKKAKTFIRNQGIQSSAEFKKWKRSGKRPKDFPSSPDLTYKEEWTGWGDFLGTGNISNRNKEFMNFEEAKTFIRNEGIQTNAEFQEWKRSGKRPEDFPSFPEQAYKEEWTGWGNFLGTGNIAYSKKEFMSFEEAKAFIRNEGIQTSRAFKAWSRSGKRPEDFPSSPERTYKDKWTGWDNFLGTGNISNRKKEFMSFEEAKTFIQSEGIQSSAEFEAWSRSGKRPEDFPSSPERTYKKEWTGWDNFLGTGNISTREEAMSFEEVKTFIQSQGIEIHTAPEEQKQSEQNFLENVPNSPDRAYNKEWTDQHTDFSESEKWMSFEEAKKYVQTLGFDQPRDFIEWLRSSNRPVHFPPNPHQFYSEWISVKDFLSTEQYVSYKEAKTFVQSLAITNSRDFLELMKDESDIFPDNFPSNPKVFYSKKGDWIDWNDFLGITDQSKNKTDDRRILNTEDNLQNEGMEEDNFIDEIDV